MNFQNIANKPREFLAMTGFNMDEFCALLPWFEKELSESKYTLEGAMRKNKHAGYKNSIFQTIEEKLFFILVYFKQYTTQSMLAMSFKISQPKANKWIHFLAPILQSALSEMKVAPCRDMEELSLQEASVFAHDGTERPIQRPKDKKEQKKFYSGKQKSHTVKNNILADINCKVIFITPTVEGKKHDKKLADESKYKLPKGSMLLQDTGYQGFTLEGVCVLQPKKKPRGKELSQEDKDYNREISQVRVRIEHVISGIKRYRIVKDKCRNWLKGFKDVVIEIACGLHNLRLEFRPWEKIELR